MILVLVFVYMNGLTVTENQNEVTVDNSWDPVSNGADSAVLKLGSDNLLDQIVCCCVN